MIVTITGQTCSGKSTLEAYLATHFGYNRIVSHTTRSPRRGEVDGHTYHFVTGQQFDDLDNWIEQVKYNGHQYGMHSSELVAGVNVVVVEPLGVGHVAQWCAQNKVPHLRIYVGVPRETQLERFLGRFYHEVENLGTLDDDLNPEDACFSKESLIVRYAARLQNILDVESHWEHHARMDDSYDLVVPHYGPDNEMAVGDLIKSIVQTNEEKSNG